MEMPQPQPRRLLRKQEVLKLLRIKRSALDEAIARGDFPPPAKIFENGRAVAWDESEVLSHVERRFAARKNVTSPMTIEVNEDETGNSLPHVNEDETGNSLPHEHRTDQSRTRQHHTRNRRTAGRPARAAK
jgi:predicted DNA-binding transcriptional regulator AlpA